MAQNSYIRLTNIEDLEQWVFSGAWIELPDMEKSFLRITIQDMARDTHNDYPYGNRSRAQQMLHHLDGSSGR